MRLSLESSISLIYFIFQILYDFKILFPNVKENALKNMWSFMQKAIFNQHVKLDQDDGITHDETTTAILMLLKLFAPPRIALETTIKSLVIFSKVRLIAFA